MNNLPISIHPRLQKFFQLIKQTQLKTLIRTRLSSAILTDEEKKRFSSLNR